MHSFQRSVRRGRGAPSTAKGAGMADGRGFRAAMASAEAEDELAIADEWLENVQKRQRGSLHWASLLQQPFLLCSLCLCSVTMFFLLLKRARRSAQEAARTRGTQLGDAVAACFVSNEADRESPAWIELAHFARKQLGECCGDAFVHCLHAHCISHKTENLQKAPDAESNTASAAVVEQTLTSDDAHEVSTPSKQVVAELDSIASSALQTPEGKGFEQMRQGEISREDYKCMIELKRLQHQEEQNRLMEKYYAEERSRRQEQQSRERLRESQQMAWDGFFTHLSTQVLLLLAELSRHSSEHILRSAKQACTARIQGISGFVFSGALRNLLCSTYALAAIAACVVVCLLLMYMLAKPSLRPGAPVGSLLVLTLAARAGGALVIGALGADASSWQAAWVGSCVLYALLMSGAKFAFLGSPSCSSPVITLTCMLLAAFTHLAGFYSTYADVLG